MNNSLADLFANRIATGLKRASVTTPAKWAEAYRVMAGSRPGPWSFKHHPWLEEMHNSKNIYNVGMKAAQMGFTETMLNLTFYNVDVLGRDCLYVLPAKNPDASDFSSSRFDAALEASPHLAKLFTDRKNIGHKRAGSANLYIRGSQSRSALKSVPVSLLILDEVEEMVQEHIPLAFERVSGQLEKLIWMISTPSIPNFGISKYFNPSTQEEFFFECPSCSKLIRFVFPDSMVITAEDVNDPRLKDTHLICTECKNILPHETKADYLSTGRYVPSFSNRDTRGFSVSQLYSTTVHPKDLALSYLKGLTNPADETEFFNSKLGKTHTVEGSKLNDTNIQDVLESRHMLEPIKQGNIITMGVDVGKWNYWEITEWFYEASIDPNSSSHCRVIRVGKTKSFEDLYKIAQEHGVLAGVIDAQPERRKSLELCNAFYGRFKACFYTQGISGKVIRIPKNEDKDFVIQVDRTSWLDLSLGRFRSGSIRLPIDIPLEYKMHIKAPTRVYSKDVSGNPVGSYVTSDQDEDHYAHARNYSEIAFCIAVGMVFGAGVKDV
jgi:hypothetical protein